MKLNCHPSKNHLLPRLGDRYSRLRSQRLCDCYIEPYQRLNNCRWLVVKGNGQALSWKLMDRDKAAGFACNRAEVLTFCFFSSPLGCKALKRPSLLKESYLIPNAAHIELFAASLGSSILNVFGTTTELSSLFASECSFPSELFGLRSSPFLECLPSGELGPEPVAF